MAKGRKRSASDGDQPLTRELRSAIADDARNLNALAVAAGIDQAAVRRFVSRERGLTLDSADRLAVVLGLTIVRKGRGRPAKSRPIGTPPVPVPPGPCRPDAGSPDEGVMGQSADPEPAVELLEEDLEQAPDAADVEPSLLANVSPSAVPEPADQLLNAEELVVPEPHPDVLGRLFGADSSGLSSVPGLEDDPADFRGPGPPAGDARIGCEGPGCNDEAGSMTLPDGSP